MGGVSFKNGAKTFLDSDLADTATTMRVHAGDWTKFNRANAFYCLLLGADRHEIVKVTGASVPALTIERGQEGTSAEDWPRGTLVYQALSATTLSGMVQVEAFRQGAYNPNGALASLCFGEKFYQSDDELWWKSVAAGSTEWRLIAGEILIDDVEFSPDPDTYDEGQALTMEVLAAGADIYYTDDGSTPDQNSTPYTAPIIMPVGTTTYKARAYGAYRWESPAQNVTSGQYEIVEYVPPTWVKLAPQTGDDSGTMDQIADAAVSAGGGVYMMDIDGRIAQYNPAQGWDYIRPAPASGFTYHSLCLNPDDSDYLGMSGDALGYYYFIPNSGGGTRIARNTSWYTNSWPWQMVFVPGDSIYTYVNNGGTHGNGLKAYDVNVDSQWRDVYDPATNWYPLRNGMCLHNGDLFLAFGGGDSSLNGTLHQWNGSTMTQVASRAGGIETIMSICSDGSNLYGVGRNTGNLYVWNESDAWSYLGTTPTHTYEMRAICAFGGFVFGAEAFYELFAWEIGVSTSFAQVDAGLTPALVNNCEKLFYHQYVGRSSNELYGIGGKGLSKDLYRFQIPE